MSSRTSSRGKSGEGNGEPRIIVNRDVGSESVWKAISRSYLGDETLVPVVPHPEGPWFKVTRPGFPSEEIHLYRLQALIHYLRDLLGFRSKTRGLGLREG